MKTKEEINKKIQELNDLRKMYAEKQNIYKWTEKERTEGSEQFAIYQDREFECIKKIELLEWVLK